MDDNGPFYTQLGFASTLAGLKQVFVERLGAKEGEVRLDAHIKSNILAFQCIGSKPFYIHFVQVRMEKVKFAVREGATSEGCPIAKWVRLLSCELGPITNLNSFSDNPTDQLG